MKVTGIDMNGGLRPVPTVTYYTIELHVEIRHNGNLHDYFFFFVTTLLVDCRETTPAISNESNSSP